MDRFYFFALIFCFSNLINITSAKEVTSFESTLNSTGNTLSINEQAPAAISATITGPGSVCLNSTNQNITLTGNSGTPPYTFRYKIDNVLQPSISTGGLNSSITIPITTTTQKVYNFALDSVIDVNNKQSQTGNLTVMVKSLPVADFTFTDNQCSDTPVQFTSVVTGTGPYTYSWSFGDRQTSNEQNPSIRFNSLGCGTINYQVSLTITDNNGCTSLIKTATITIKQKPDINFNDADNQLNSDPFSNCLEASASNPNYTINVGNISIDKNCILSYSIDWGDGMIAPNVIFPFSHSYSKLGAYNMKITALGKNGCSNVRLYIVKNVTNPSGGIISPGKTTDLCAPTAELKFEIANWGNNTPGTTYLVDYGDNSQIISLTQEEMVASTYYSASDPSKSSNYPIPHSFKITNCPADEFIATLSVTSACRSTVFTANSITIITKPEVNFNVPVSACANSSVLFTNTTVPGHSQKCNDMSINTWDFGDGTPLEVTPLSVPKNTSHSYTTPGNYTITLTSENFCGKASKTQQIIINTLPTATISGIGSVCMNSASPLITFTGANGTAPYTFTYSINNGSTRTLKTTTGNSVTLSAPTNVSGIFTYKLLSVQESSSSSCSQLQSGSVIITVIPTPKATISGSTNVCLNAVSPYITFTGSNGTSPYTFTYNVNGDQNQTITTTTGNSITIQVPTSTAGIFNYNLVDVKDVNINGCTQAQSGKATITVNPTPTVNIISSQIKCNGEMSDLISFTGAITGTVYKWTNSNTSIGLLTSGSGNIPSFVLNNSLTTPLISTITVTPSYTNTGNSCTGSSISFTITVNPSPSITTHPLSSKVCQGGVANLLTVGYTGLGTAGYQWYQNSENNNTTGTSIPGGHQSTYNPPTDTIDTLYYYCAITFSGGGCSNLLSHTASVIVSPIPVIKNQPIPLQTLCIGSTIPVPLTVGFTGGADNASYQWYSSESNRTTGGILIPGATNFNYTPPAFSAVGNYYYYVLIKFEGSACEQISSDSAKIIVTTMPTITLQPEITQTLCKNSAPINLSVTAADGSGQFSYQWYSNTSNNTGSGSEIQGATSNIFVPSTSIAGTTFYYCIVSQPKSAGCSVTSATSELIVKIAPRFTIQPVSGTVCLGGTPLPLHVDYSNGTLNPQIQWFSNASNSVVGGSPVSGAINLNFNPPSESIGTLYYYCVVTFATVGCSNITSLVAKVTVNALPVISNYVIEINSGETFTVSPDSLKGDTVPVGTTYTWPAPVITPPNSITGATSKLIPQAKISESLTNKTTGIATVTYTVTPTSGNCTGNNFNIVVTVHPPVNPAAVVINGTCFGSNDGSIQTTIEGGVPFTTGNPYLTTWSGPNNYRSTDPSITGLFPGIYILTIKDSSGFTITTNYTVQEPDSLNLETISVKNISCFAASNGEIVLALTGGTLPYKYTWKKDAVPFEGTNNVANLGPGNYSVSATDANNCGPVIASYQITEPAAMVIKLTTQTNLTCYGDTTGTLSVNIEGGVPFEKTPGIFDYKYSWAGPNEFKSIEKDLINIAAGIYTLTVTDSTGCGQNFNATITQPAEIKINAITSPVTCYGENNASIKLDIQGGIPPYQIQWSNYGKGLLQENLSPGTYTITVTDTSGCFSSKEVIITEAEFSIQPIIKNITCFGAQDGSIHLNIKGGIPPVILSWADNPTAGSTRNRLKAGIYTATLSDGSSCSFSRSFTIIEPTELKISGRITNAFDCDNQNSGSIDLSITGGTQPYTISWSNGDTTAHLPAIPAGTYVVEVTDAGGCAYTGKFEVIRPAPIQLSVKSVPDFDCQLKVLKEISTAQITGGVPPYQFTWSGGTTKGLNNEIMETSQSGIYNLGVVDGKGCTSDYTFHLDVPNPGIDYHIIKCDAHIFAFNTILPSGIASDYTFGWDFGDGKSETTQNPQHTFPTSGTYKVRLTLISPACTSIFEKIITVESSPVLVLDKLPVFCIGDSLLLHVSGAESYRWNNGTTGDSLLIKQTGEYSVSGTSKAGCTATLAFKATNFDSYTFTIQSDKNEVTTVDPTIRLWSESITYSEYFWDFGDAQSAVDNNQTHSYVNLKDGYYDVKLKVKNPNGCMEFATRRIWRTNTSTGNVFTPNGDGIDDIFLSGWHIQIYNRNGILIYEGIEGWDGTYKGKPVSNDTYFYILYISGAKEINKRTGFVTVIR